MSLPFIPRVATALPRTEPAPAPDAAAARILSARLQQAGQARLGRSLALFHLDTGGCHGCVLELTLLNSAVHAIERLGLTFVDTPRHADVLLVSGAVTRTLAPALVRTLDAMPAPSWVVAIGDCAANGGLFRASPAILGGAEAAVPVDLIVPGCPPRPAEILAGLLTLLAAHSR